jgi:hypothetical protein
VNARAQQIVAERQASAKRQETQRNLRDFVASVSQVVDRMERFTTDADTRLAELSRAENRYRAITAKMSAYVDRESQLAGNTNTSVARAQLVVAANQASIATSQLHISAQSFQRSFDSNVRPMAAALTDFEKICREQALSLLTSAQRAARDAACERLLESDRPFRHKFEVMDQAIVEVEQVYLAEQSAQENLLRTAQQIQ